MDDTISNLSALDTEFDNHVIDYTDTVAGINTEIDAIKDNHETEIEAINGNLVTM